jgi:hypothetical protein
MVSSGNAAVVDSVASATKGKFIFYDVDNGTYSISADTLRFKIGMGTGKTAPQINPTTKALDQVPVIKWSNVINVADIKGVTTHTNAGDTQDIATIDFSNINDGLVNLFAQGGKRIIVRLTFKDLPTRFRKWTESYEYVTKAAEISQSSDITAYKNTIAEDVVTMINKEYKRARVKAILGNMLDTTDQSYVADDDDIAIKGDFVFRSANSGTTVMLRALTYDDDNTVDSLNWANTVRFNVNLYYTDPAAEGWESTNKHFPDGVTIDKVPGKIDSASAKLVRDREAQAMGYDGILNRGEGTWPIIKPDMNVKLDETYNSITIEFENMYRAADDIFRKTKQTVEIYVSGTTKAITDELDKVL